MKKRPLYIFDFDDTLALTNSTVLVTRADGSEERLNSREFAKYRQQPGDELDFSGFMSVPGGSLIDSTVAEMESAISKHGIRSVYIVTARAFPSRESVKSFLESNGVTVPHVVTTAGSEGKAGWLESMLITGDWDEVRVYEDCTKNISMLEKVVEDYNQEVGQLRGKPVRYFATCIVEEAVRDYVRSILSERYGANW